MNDDFYRGRLFGILFYIIGCINCLIGIALSDGASPITSVSVITCMLVPLIILNLISHKVSHLIYKHIQLLAFTFLGVLFSYCYGSIQIFYMVIAIQSILSVLYIDSKFEHQQLIVSTFLMIAAIIVRFPGLEEISLTEYFIFTFTAAGIQWICRTCVTAIEVRDHINLEQEKSLDDMLKVIEVKCDEARAATKSKSEFLSNMSHEIRTPLNSVLGMNELILRETEDNNIRDYSRNIESSGRLLLSLINDILDFSKIESGKMDIIPVNYHLSSLINDTVIMLAQRFKDKGLKLDIKVNKDIPNGLLGDEVRVRQILTNIMTNALKYTDKGFVLLVADYEVIDSDNIILILSVQDTGRGIKPEEKEKLFKSFTRIDQKRNRNIEGTGLGLSITYSLVTAMKGSITVDSLYGSGSVFSVRIPQRIVDSKPVGDFSSRIDEQSGSETYHETFTAPDAKILVTDDNKSNLLVAKGLLKKTLVQIDTAISGSECIEKLRTTRYDVIFLDHMMPDMDGIETLTRIKEEGLDNGVPIVALTANAISGAREMYLECGFSDYLSKPIEGKSLERMLIQLLPKELVNIDENSAPKNEEHRESSSDENNAPIIDHDVAMKYVDNSDELYMIVLQTYVEQGPEYLGKLDTFFREKDIDNYRIVSHSIKSTSLNIGAVAVSEQAKRHEYAAKDNDIDTIAADHESFVSNYRAAIDEADKLFKELETKLGY